MEKTIKRLNGILEKNYDAEQGYKNAAENVDDPELSSYFREWSQVRYDFGHEIKEEIRSLGGKPDKGGSFLGGIHRTWMDIKAALGSDDEEDILEECIRGEKASLEEYQEVLEEEETPTSTSVLLQKHVEAIEDAISQMKILEEKYD